MLKVMITHVKMMDFEGLMMFYSYYNRTSVYVKMTVPEPYRELNFALQNKPSKTYIKTYAQTLIGI